MNKTLTVGNKKLEIFTDENPMNPRTDWDGQISKMIFFHKRYRLGDKHDVKSSDFNSFEEMKGYIMRKFNGRVILPVYMYDHSGITVSTKPFSCPWDSGQIGFMVATKETVENCMGWKVVTKKRKEELVKYMEGELETYDDFLTGNVYGFTITNTETEEEIHSCSGFYGSDPKTNGMLDHLGKEFEAVL